MATTYYTYSLIWFMDPPFKRDKVAHALLYSACGDEDNPDRIYAYGDLDVKAPYLAHEPKRGKAPANQAIWYDPQENIYHFYPGQGKSYAWYGYANKFGPDSDRMVQVAVDDRTLENLGSAWKDKNTQGKTNYPFNCRGAVDYVIVKVTGNDNLIEYFSQSERNALHSIL